MMNQNRERWEEEYRPISAWGYFGYEILFAIPVLGVILAIVFSFTARNRNLKNFARSQFCFLIIVIILAALAWFFRFAQ